MGKERLDHQFHRGSGGSTHTDNLCATGEVCTSDGGWQATINVELARVVGG